MSRTIICVDVLLLCILTSCSIRQFYPTGGAIIGGSAGALTGNPVIAGLTAGSGAMLGEMAKGNAELEEAQKTITALTHGDVEALVTQGMSKHQSLFDQFTGTIKKILIIAGVCLAVYLLIPIFVAKKCSKDEAIKMTRAPFTPSRPSYPRRKSREDNEES
jgi:hypothetical protein